MHWPTLVRWQRPDKWLSTSHLGTLCRCCTNFLAPHTTLLSSLYEPLNKVKRHRSAPARTNSSRWLCIMFLLMLTSTELVAACGPGRKSNARRNQRKLTPLVFKQHAPNVGENTLGASGLSEGRVSRNHKRFKELVPNYNPDIIFKDDEGTGADRLMTQRLKEKLNTLAISVMNQWPGVRLRVIQSWHEGSQYQGDSLHYEGRAVDITTSDKDRSKLGMLARLAAEAGFDWVYYESRVWIHCSVKSEKSESARNGGCFDQDSVVYDRTGPRLIREIQIGDEILTMAPNGQFEYSRVLMFLDRDPNVKRLYYRIQTESGFAITATPSHLLFVADEQNSASAQQSLGSPQFVRDLSVDQYLYTSHGNQSGSLEKIVNITTQLGQGAYAPLTATGNLLVNNITASCYAVFQSQSMAHLSFIPVRWMHHFVQFSDRLSNFLLFNSRGSLATRSATSLGTWSQTASQEGVHWYPRLLYTVFKYLIPSKMLYS